MKLNDFIKQDPIPKRSGYKVVMGNSPKEQELAKEASKVTSLENSLNELKEKYDKVVEENEFFKQQIKRTQHEIDEAKGKVETQQNLQLELVQKENQMILIKEEKHELTIKEQRNSERINQLEIDLNSKTNEHDQLLRENDKTINELQSITANHNGLRADFNKQKDFSEKLQNDYNKIGERNTGLLSEREELSKLKAEFEAKSIRLGEELIRAQEKLKNLNERLTKVESKNVITDAEIVKKNNFADKLQENFKTIYKSKNDLETKLIESRKDVKDLSKMAYIYKDKLMKEKQESINWNIAKQELKFGQGETYSNKLGFGSNPLFKLPKEK